MKSKLILASVYFALFGLISDAFGQNTHDLTLQEAVVKALEQNHTIIISQNLANIDENSATPGNAGYLPSVTLNSEYFESVQDSRFEFFDENEEQNISGNRSNNLNASVNLNWVLFDGFGNRYRLQALRKTRDLSAAQSRQQIEDVLLNVISGYLEVNLQSQFLDVNREAVEISNQRYRRAERNYDLGGGSQVDLLNAEVALNRDSIRVVEAELALTRARRNLLILIGEDPSSEISTLGEFSINHSLSIDGLMQSALSKNARLRAVNIESDRTQLQLQQSRSGRYPQLSTRVSYNYNRIENDAGQFIFQEANGVTAGVTLSFSIFDGFRRNIEVQNNQIRVKNSIEQNELVENEVRRNLMNAYDTYRSNLYLFEKQQLNVETAELNFERTRMAFEQGQVTNTDFREAQLSLLESQQEFIVRRAETKRSEIELLQISGQLLNVVE